MAEQATEIQKAALASDQQRVAGGDDRLTELLPGPVTGCYIMLNDSANFLMLLFCKQINTVQKSCYAARRGIGHLPYKLLSHRSVKRTPAAYDNESEENRRARRIP
ncbi:bifunctional aconitate hydratase 2/2-methylisocitrate dehydratase [Enterobacter hormaechei]|nr:bifunctional aconitate hydratase 2/2-methylisocitrate dehydratase [Enterobacter hormaechei]CZZ28692.1 bifunctional aconitate hydratase 2/2-methylisocitrate dehydratase [Enterobacter hormaechei]CZZ44230.1 bifunctional aconitate hydratase 2/2-methylisocitrate dehydratase [Enterobacter hormaechei]SAF83407.1 bifunctional aconitate hydratase 2/2-methylisocitrate dehydratase [Enterobacter hormaechei]